MDLLNIVELCVDKVGLCSRAIVFHGVLAYKKFRVNFCGYLRTEKHVDSCY